MINIIKSMKWCTRNTVWFPCTGGCAKSLWKSNKKAHRSLTRDNHAKLKNILCVERWAWNIWWAIKTSWRRVNSREECWEVDKWNVQGFARMFSQLRNDIVLFNIFFNSMWRTTRRDHKHTSEGKITCWTRNSRAVVSKME